MRPRVLGPLNIRAGSRDREIVGAQKTVSKGCPNTPPTSCSSVVTDPRVQCEVTCDRALNRMLFQGISIRAGPHMIKRNKSTVASVRSAVIYLVLCYVCLQEVVFGNSPSDHET